MSDVEILEQFVARQDEAAFELLLRRHGPMVLKVCRQALFDPHDVEDAFQATFLVLVCKASSIRVEESLGPWLYRVASRTSARARAKRRRRRDREVPSEEHPEPSVTDDPDRVEIPRVIQDEIGRLPERLRAPVVLCYLEGMTHELAARELRCPVGTVRSRLARARAILQKRITRRGFVIPAAAMTAVLESSSRAAALPPQIQRSLIKLATRFASGSASIRGGVGVSASVANLLEGVLNVMRVKKLASVAGALLAVGAMAVVVGTSAFPAAGQTDDGPDTRLEIKDGKTIGPDRRPMRSARVKPGPQVVTKTYYMGDLIGTKPPGPGESGRPIVDLRPLIDLIASTVVRGSWNIQNGAGNDITFQFDRGGRSRGNAASEPVGTITPFLPSASLVIRCTPEVHNEVGDLLRRLRRLLDARNNPGVDLDREEDKLGLPPHTTDPKPVVPKQFSGRAVVRPSEDNRARIRELLDALRQEVEKLPKDHD
jgi:RNA polymerase sigma factor (sigma-70 family)